MNCADHYDLCIEVVPDPEDENIILIRETDDPDVVVRTPRKNWEKFLEQVKNGDLDGV